jgi:iron complex outermembrane receptor protein
MPGVRSGRSPQAVGIGLVGIWSATVAWMGAFFVLVVPGSTWAGAAPSSYDFDIPPQSLPSALLDFSAQVDRQIIVATRLVDRYMTAGVTGRMTIEEAMTQLLEGTDLSFDVLGSHSLRIVRAQPMRSAPRDVQVQDRPVRVPTAAEEAQTSGLEEIIVTARRREENVQDVPIFVDVFSEESMARQDIRTFTDLETMMTGVDTCCGRGNVSAFTFIRGINNAVGYFAEVPTLLNGSAFYFDVGNMEVLKGPQGTLFGIATNGGAIVVEPARPTRQFGGYSSVTLGDYDRQTYESVVNLPVSDTLSFRVGVQYESRDGYVHDITNNVDLGNEHYWTARVSALWDITDKLQNYFVANYHESDTRPAPLGIPYGPTAGIAPGGLFQQAFGGAALNSWIAQSLRLWPYTIVGTDVPGGPRDVLHQINVTDILTYDLTSHLKIKNIIGFYSSRDNAVADTDGTPFAGYETGIPPTTFSGPTLQYSEEFQLQGETADKRLSYVIGSFNSQNNIEDPRVSYQEVLGVKSGTLSVTSGHTHSLFAEGTYGLDTILEGLALTAGYRRTWDERAASQELFNAAGVPLSNFDASDKWSKGSYRLGLTYHPAPNTMLYFTNSKGYSAGGFNLTAPSAADQRYDPEVLDNFEVGVKSEWLIGDIEARTNLSAYYGLYDNIQAQVTTRCETATGPVFCQLTRNAATGKIDGFESEFTVIPADWLMLAGNVGFMEGRYTRYNGLDPTGKFEVDLSGTGFLYLPKWKYSLTSIIKFPTPDSIGHLSLSPAWSWTDKINCCFTLGPPEYYTTSPAMKNLNLTLKLSQVAGNPHLSTTLVVTNATQNEVMHGQWGVYEQLGQYARAVAVPRMWALTVRYDF